MGPSLWNYLSILFTLHGLMRMPDTSFIMCCSVTNGTDHAPCSHVITCLRIWPCMLVALHAPKLKIGLCSRGGHNSLRINAERLSNTGRVMSTSVNIDKPADGRLP